MTAPTTETAGARHRGETVLCARDVHRIFQVGSWLSGDRATVHAVNGIDLDLGRGETIGIVGESGSGKSTLAQLLAGLDRVTSGEIELLGEPLHTMSRRQLRHARRHVQLVHQDPFTSLDPRMAIGAIVREPLDVHPDVVPRTGRRRAVAELLEMVGLNPDHAGRLPHQFSGGQRQRVGIARALALRPEVLVCDEPVSALDVSVQAQIINLLERLQAELGLAYVFIAHDLAVVQHIADRVAVMYLGRVVEQGSHAEVYDRPRHPYTKALLAAIPKPDRASRHASRSLVLRGEPPSALDPPSGCHFRTRCWQAQEVCAAQSPALLPAEPGAHAAACHFPLVPAAATGSAGAAQPRD